MRKKSTLMATEALERVPKVPKWRKGSKAARRRRLTAEPFSHQPSTQPTLTVMLMARAIEKKSF